MPISTHDAGVYLLRNRKTGDTYIGATCFLTKRINDHMADIRKSGGVYGAFEGCTPEDVEVRVIERVVVKCTICDSGGRLIVRTDPASKPGLAKLWERERYWIRTVKPSLNRQNVHGRVDVSKLPVGLPDDLVAATSN